jgi:hypothetical protein
VLSARISELPFPEKKTPKMQSKTVPPAHMSLHAKAESLFIGSFVRSFIRPFLRLFLCPAVGLFASSLVCV